MTTPTFADAKAIRDRLYLEASTAGAVLKSFPKGPMGLTPDAVKVSTEFRAAKARYAAAFGTLRAVNAMMTKRYAKELRAERAARNGLGASAKCE